jgi:hypothetical protein
MIALRYSSFFSLSFNDVRASRPLFIL